MFLPLEGRRAHILITKQFVFTCNYYVIKNGANVFFFFFLFFYHLNIVDVSVIKLIFGSQWVHLILFQWEESAETVKGKGSSLIG